MVIKGSAYMKRNGDSGIGLGGRQEVWRWKFGCVRKAWL